MGSVNHNYRNACRPWSGGWHFALIVMPALLIFSADC